MYSFFRSGFRYLQYLLRASNGKGHGTHSPFVFSFITKVLNDDRNFYAYQRIEDRRRSLLADTRVLAIADMGAGSQVEKTNTRSVKDIAASSLKPAKFGQLLFRMVNHYAPATVLELGTSLGITTAYLAAACEEAQVTTMEGAPSVAAVARENFSKLQLPHICVVEGNFDETLQATANAIDKIDFCFIDGNHRYEPTLRYYHELLPHLHEHSILVFDDIYWSREMEKAWTDIKQQQDVTLTIDLFFIGIVFFRRENKVKQHFTIRF